MDMNPSLLGVAELVVSLLGATALSVVADATVRRLTRRFCRSSGPKVRALWLPPVYRRPPYPGTAEMRQEEIRLRIEAANARPEPGVAADLYLVSQHGRKCLECTPRRVATGSEVLFDQNLYGLRARLARGETFRVELRWNGRRVRAPVSASLIHRRKV